MSVLIKTSPTAAALLHDSHYHLLHFPSGFLLIFSYFKVNSKHYTLEFAKMDV